MEDIGFVETWSKQKFSPERDVFNHVFNALFPLYLVGVSRNRHYLTPVPQVASTSTIAQIWEKFDRGCSRFYFSKDGHSNASCPHDLLEPYLSLIKRWRQDFSGGPVVKNLPSREGTRVQSLVWVDCTCFGATTEPACPCSATREDTKMRHPCTTTRESLQAARKTKHSQKKKKKEVETDPPSLESFGLEALTNTFWGTWHCLIPWLDHKRPCSFSLTAGTRPLRATMTDVWVIELPCFEEARAHGEARCPCPWILPAQVQAWGHMSLQMIPARLLSHPQPVLFLNFWLMKSMNLMKWLLCYATKFGMVCSLAIVTKSELFLKFAKHP